MTLKKFLKSTLIFAVLWSPVMILCIQQREKHSIYFVILILSVPLLLSGVLAIHSAKNTHIER